MGYDGSAQRSAGESESDKMAQRRARKERYSVHWASPCKITIPNGAACPEICRRVYAGKTIPPELPRGSTGTRGLRCTTPCVSRPATRRVALGLEIVNERDDAQRCDDDLTLLRARRSKTRRCAHRKCLEVATCGFGYMIHTEIDSRAYV